eukprot:359870-Chlamydomonas_euryale.AAC.1
MRSGCRTLVKGAAFITHACAELVTDELSTTCKRLPQQAAAVGGPCNCNWIGQDQPRLINIGARTRGNRCRSTLPQRGRGLRAVCRCLKAVLARSQTTPRAHGSGTNRWPPTPRYAAPFSKEDGAAAPCRCLLYICLIRLFHCPLAFNEAGQ